MQPVNKAGRDWIEGLGCAKQADGENRLATTVMFATFWW